MRASTRTGRAVATALGAGLIGILLGSAVGQIATVLGVARELALVGTLVLGAVLAGLGQLVAFRHELPSRRWTTAVLTTVGSVMVFTLARSVLEPVVLDTLSPQLVLGLSVVGAAVMARWVATQA